MGETSLEIPWRTSVVSLPVTEKKTSLTRASCRPPASIASIVLAKVGASFEPAIASISFRRWAIPSLNAGR